MLGNRPLVLLWLVALATSLPAAPGAEEKARKKRIRTQDVAEAGPDYRVQGEYIGYLVRDGDPEMFGVQVIARGNGTFEAKGLRGGLPGAGWDRTKKIEFHGRTEEGKTVLEPTGGSGGNLSLVIEDGAMEVVDPGGDVAGRLVRVIRKSPTLGKKPPEDALVLFDGTTAEHFRKKRGGTPEVTEEGYLELARGSGGLFTKKAFGDCRLHLEFRLPFEPEGGGQGRANSGCYLQGRYEVQILDSFGLDGRENQCGGMYSSGADPAVNMCFPPLTWQTFDIDFTAARFDDEGKKTRNARLTVYHNGVPVYVEQEIGHTTTASPVKDETPEKLPHYLQDHGHRILFKNIWVVEKENG